MSKLYTVGTIFIVNHDEVLVWAETYDKAVNSVQSDALYFGVKIGTLCKCDLVFLIKENIVTANEQRDFIEALVLTKFGVGYIIQSELNYCESLEDE